MAATRKRTTRKKATARKTTATRRKTTARRKSTAAQKPRRREGILAKYNETAEQIVELHKKYDGDWAKISKASKVGVARAKRLHSLATVKPSERIVGTDAEMGKEIARLWDSGEVSFPELWGRTGGIPHNKVYRLYEQATGRSWKDAPHSKKSAGGRKATSTRKRTPAQKKTAAQKKTTAARSTARSGKKVLSLIHNLDTPEEQVTAALEGKSVIIARSVDGRAAKPKKVQVVKVNRIAPAKSGGKAVAFVDADQKSRVINLADITSVS